MKKFIFGILLSIILAVPTAVLALNIGTKDNSYLRNAAKQAGYSESTTDTTFAANIGFVIKTALSFVAVIFMVLMVYAGYLWMTARGDEGKVDKSIEIIRAAVIGMIITVGAYSITNFVVPMILERTADTGGASGTFGVCCVIAEPPGAGGVSNVIMTFLPGETEPAVCEGSTYCPGPTFGCSGVANSTQAVCQ